MKICLYSPYIPKHFGGGEKYLLDVATQLSRKHKVVVAVPSGYRPDELTQVIDQYRHFFARSLDKVSFLPAPILSGKVWQKLAWTKQFDVCYAVTDGSLFFSAAKKNILHIQVPFQHPLHSPIDRLKLANWPVRTSNSDFTRQVVEHAWRTKIQYVHYPAIDQSCFQPILHKQKVIVNVGRFFRQLHSKRQDILVQAFAQLRHHQPTLSKGWKLVLIGGVEDQTYFQEVQQFAKSLPVEFYTQLSRTEVLKWYQKASIYWHAAGYQVDAAQHPERVEHFGISTAEAMASGCIPIVVGQGGQREVLGDQLTQLQWQTVDECIQLTTEILHQESDWPAWQAAAQQQARHFSEARFSRLLYEMIES